LRQQIPKLAEKLAEVWHWRPDPENDGDPILVFRGGEWKLARKG
jgi:hypothetical protein